MRLVVRACVFFLVGWLVGWLVATAGAAAPITVDVLFYEMYLYTIHIVVYVYDVSECADHLPEHRGRRTEVVCDRWQLSRAPRKNTHARTHNKLLALTARPDRGTRLACA